MAYWGYMRFIRQYLSQCKNPQVIEIGLDKGQMFIPLLSWMTTSFEKFQIIGIDVFIKDSFRVQLELMQENIIHSGNIDKQVAVAVETSSIEALELLTREPKNHGTVNIILIDGDHNYYTVKRELEYAKKLLHRRGIIVLDDYSNRWGEKDEYFAELPGYENNKYVMKREDIEDPEKKGVAPAVDEFLEENEGWVLTDIVHPGSEPRILYRKDWLDLASPDGKILDLQPGKNDFKKGEKP